MDSVTGMIVERVFDVAEAEDLTIMQVVNIGASIILSALLKTRPETRSRLKEEIKVGLLATLVDVEEYAAKFDAEPL
jgi:hypothetical protein